MAEEYSSALKVIILMVAFAGLLALVFFGLSVLLINIGGWLRPTNSKSQLDRVVMIAGARQIRKQKTAKIS
jgi:hypothetical protein